MLVAVLLDSLAADGADYMPPGECAEHAVVIDLVNRLAMTTGGSLAGVTLRELVEQAEAAGRDGLQPAVES